MIFNLIILCACVSLVYAQRSLRIATLTDVHIGESCTKDDYSYENCKPTRALTDAVSKINELATKASLGMLYIILYLENACLAKKACYYILYRFIVSPLIYGCCF
jgi:hypothetical protein